MAVEVERISENQRFLTRVLVATAHGRVAAGRRAPGEPATRA